MQATLREAFNAAWTPERYAAFRENLHARCGAPIPFRVCETPCFFPAALLQQLADYGRALVEQLLANPACLAAAAETIPPAYRVPGEVGEAARPLFVQADFGLLADGTPKLVEIQGFPSLYAYQSALAQSYQESYGLPPTLTPFLEGRDADSYHALVRRAIVGEHDPQNVVLLEVQPTQQKTYVDFALTERLYGVAPVCLTQVQVEGKRLYYLREGKRVRIERIYNRVIVDELQRKGITPPFDFREDWEVEWAGHPSWYFKLSKFSLPYLDHPCLPKTWFLDQLTALPTDLERYVLKPLYSFAGQGVRVGPTRAELEAVADRSQYILQERMDFAPVIDTPAGPTKAEIRVMYLWLDTLQAVTTLVRLGRGTLMGVDQNQDQTWIGASVGLSC